MARPANQKKRQNSQITKPFVRAGPPMYARNWQLPPSSQAELGNQTQKKMQIGPTCTSRSKWQFRFQFDQQPLGTPLFPPTAKGFHRPEFLPSHDPSPLIVGRKPLGPSDR